MKVKDGALPKHEGQSKGEQSTAAKLRGREPHEIDRKRSDSFKPDGTPDQFEGLESYFPKPTVAVGERPSAFAHRGSEADASIIGLNDGSKKAPKGKGSAKDIALKKALEALYKQKFENYFGNDEEIPTTKRSVERKPQESKLDPETSKKIDQVRSRRKWGRGQQAERKKLGVETVDTKHIGTDGKTSFNNRHDRDSFDNIHDVLTGKKNVKLYEHPIKKLKKSLEALYKDALNPSRGQLRDGNKPKDYEYRHGKEQELGRIDNVNHNIYESPQSVPNDFQRQSKLASQRFNKPLEEDVPRKVGDLQIEAGDNTSHQKLIEASDIDMPKPRQRHIISNDLAEKLASINKKSLEALYKAERTMNKLISPIQGKPSSTGMTTGSHSGLHKKVPTKVPKDLLRDEDFQRKVRTSGGGKLHDEKGDFSFNPKQGKSVYTDDNGETHYTIERDEGAKDKEGRNLTGKQSPKKPKTEKKRIGDRPTEPSDAQSELKKLMLARAASKSDQEQGLYGTAGSSSNVGISTDTKIDADKEYEGESHEDKKEEFKYEDEKPKVDQDKNKAVPLSQLNTWGIRYMTKEEREKFNSGQ